MVLPYHGNRPILKTEANLTLEAAVGTSLGDFEVDVTGDNSTKGADTSTEFKITVGKKRREGKEGERAGFPSRHNRCVPVS